jgi:hypothetical protein
VTGVGCRSREATISLDNVSIDMSLFTANGLLFGCTPDMLKDNQNSFTIKRDGSVAERDRWFA